MELHQVDDYAKQCEYSLDSITEMVLELKQRLNSKQIQFNEIIQIIDVENKLEDIQRSYYERCSND